MPWAATGRPAIGLSILKARLAEEGSHCDVGYPNIRMAEILNLQRYDTISDKLGGLFFAGDWLFSEFLHGDTIDRNLYLATLKERTNQDERCEAVMIAREHIERFLEECFDLYRPADYDVIGFTSTFEQNMASLAFAKLIKDRYPDKIVVMGGANCEGVMGQQLHRCFPWMDWICSGESDYSFPEAVRRHAAGEPLAGIPGLLYRDEKGGTAPIAPADKVHNMDALPDPDYDDYFAAVRASPLHDILHPALLIETARGCWWGAKSHCTFCGLNGDTMAFRAKSAERTLAELQRLRTRYGISHFVAVDNILPYEYFRNLLPELRERKLGITMFYEIKSNLKREHVELLRDAGVTALQPGVESLSTHVLKLMGKGVTAIQNVQMLRLCREYRIQIAWNLLFGFPGETETDYDESAALMQAICHLQPPGAVARIRLDRFSPNFNQAEQFGLVEVKPFWIYTMIYPFPIEVVGNLAYFFNFQYRDGRNPHEYAKRAIDGAQAWKEKRSGDLLMYVNEQGELMVQDTRPHRPVLVFPMTGLQKELYQYCSDIRTKAEIYHWYRKKAGDGETTEGLDLFLDQMVDNQLMWKEGSQYLSLAVGVG